jgi:hypothetical protein
MRVVREQQTLVLSVNLVEGRILSEVLHALIQSYRLQPGDLDAATRAVWYSTRGCDSAKMSADETAEWMAALREGKGALVEHLQRWVEQLRSSTQPGPRLRIKCDDAPSFLTAINDYRLRAAARHDIGQAEMDLDWSDPAAALPLERQRALVEIDFLAWMMEMILQAAAS